MAAGQEVIEILFRARDAEKVAQASRNVGDGLEDLARQGAEGAQGLDAVEREAKEADKALDELAQQRDQKIKAEVDPAAAARGKRALEDLGRGAKRAREETDKLNKSGRLPGMSQGTQNLLKQGAAVVGLIGGVAALARGYQALVNAGKEAINLASIQQQSNLALQVSLSTVGEYSVAAANDLKAYASAVQQTTQFGDEMVIKTASLIQQLGGLSGDALKKATTASLDMAVALEQSADSVAILLGKAAAGETGSLSRYGILIDTTLPKSKQFDAVLKSINDSFGGTAESRVKSYAGAVAQMSNAWGDLGEALGEFVLPVLTSVSNRFAKLFADWAAGLRRVRGETDEAASELIDRLGELQDQADRAGASGAIRKAREELEKLKGVTLDQLKLEVDGGDLETLIGTMQRLDEQIAEAAEKGQDILVDFLRDARREALEGIQYRMDVETERATSKVRAAIKAMRGEDDVHVLIRGTADFQDASKELDAYLEEVEALRSTEIEAPVKNAEKIAEMTAEVERLEAELLKVRDRIRETTENAPTLQLGIEASGIDRILASNLSRALDNARNQIGDFRGSLAIASADQASVAEAMILTQDQIDEAEALKARFDLELGEAQDDNRVRDLLREYETAFEKVVQGIERNPGSAALAAQIRKDIAAAQQAADLRIEVLGRGDLQDAISLILQLQEAGGKTTQVKALDTERLIGDLENSAAAAAALGSAVDDIVEGGDSDTLATSIRSIDAALVAAEKGTIKLEAAMVSAFVAAKAKMEEAFRALEPFQQAEILQATAEIQIDKGNLEEAELILKSIVALAESNPTLGIDVIVGDLTESIEASREKAREGGNEIGEELQDGLKEIGLSGANAVFDDAMDAMTGKARDAQEVFAQVAKSMADNFIREIARMLASAAIKGLVKFFASLGGGPIGVLGFAANFTGIGRKGSAPGGQDGRTDAPAKAATSIQGGPPSGLDAEVLRLLVRQQAIQAAAIPRPQSFETAGEITRRAALLSGGTINQNVRIEAIDSMSFEQYMQRGGPGRTGLEAALAMEE